MGNLTVDGAVVGVIQQDQKFFARFLAVSGEEILLPIDAATFHKLKLGRATLVVTIGSGQEHGLARIVGKKLSQLTDEQRWEVGDKVDNMLRDLNLGVKHQK